MSQESVGDDGSNSESLQSEAVNDVERAARLYVAVISDVLDALGLRNQAMQPSLHAVAAQAPLVGYAATIRVVAVDQMPESPYQGVFRAVDGLRPDEVIVVAAPEKASGFWGELITTRALVRGCRGALIDGYCRDVSAIRAKGFPVWARGVHPADSAGRLEAVDVGVPVVCAGVEVNQGDLVVADPDGVVAVPRARISEVLALAEAKVATEDRAREALAGSESLAGAFARFGVL